MNLENTGLKKITACISHASAQPETNKREIETALT